MISSVKSEEEILKKLGVIALNEMQLSAKETIANNDEVVLLSPTGTGKTLAFLLPLIALLDENNTNIQCLILVPTRELAIQIEQVVRQMGTGFKANSVYGGRSGFQDKIDLKHTPAILIGTPGRVADHLRRDRLDFSTVDYLVLDEFDKSLEIGFETEMVEILTALINLKKKVLTSATTRVEFPEFFKLENPTILNYLGEGVAQLKVKMVLSVHKDKLESLVKLLSHIGNERGIIFCNLKDTIEVVSDYLQKNGVSHTCFLGGMEQKDRELALVKFRNGTHQLLIATDLAARGIDVPEIKFIIHFEMPGKLKDFTHRNGRTARMNADGTAYVLKWQQEYLPEFMEEPEEEKLKTASKPKVPDWETLYITAGRRDKISKGDIAGWLYKQANLKKEDIGTIEIQPECSYVAIHYKKIEQVVNTCNNSKLKGIKVRASLI